MLNFDEAFPTDSIGVWSLYHHFHARYYPHLCCNYVSIYISAYRKLVWQSQNLQMFYFFLIWSEIKVEVAGISVFWAGLL